MLEFVLLLRWIVFEHELGSDAICGTRDTCRDMKNDLECWHARDDKRVGNELYLFQKERENGRHNQIWIPGLIMQGQGIITPHVHFTQQERFS